MIKTGLADNAEDAFDVIAKGYQSGASASDDFFDTLTEYSTFFRDLGLSGAEATGLLIQGLDGGAMNADKAADALKELVVKVNDLSSADGLKELGIDIEDMRDAFAEGGLGVVQFHEEVVALCAYCILGELEQSLVIRNIGDEVHSSDGDVGLGLEGGGGEVGAADPALAWNLHLHDSVGCKSLSAV